MNQRLDGIESHFTALHLAPPVKNSHAPKLFSEEDRELTSEEITAIEPLLLITP